MHQPNLLVGMGPPSFRRDTMRPPDQPAQKLFTTGFVVFPAGVAGMTIRRL